MLLSVYELTIAEQIYINIIQPSLNNNLFANWSTKNKGSKGYIKTDKSKESISLSLLNRTYSLETVELHRKNNTAKKLTAETKKKMSEAKLSKGKSVILIDVIKNNEIKFNTLSSLSKELKISSRTINRWAIDGKIYKTKSLVYPIIKIKYF